MDKQKTKTLLLAGVRIIGFSMVFLLLLHFSSIYFLPAHEKAEDGTVSYITYGYRGEPKNTLDMVAVGNSDLYCGLSPIELWNQYGIASYVAGEPLQKMTKSYRVIKDVFRYQKPKVIVLEVDSAFSSVNDNYRKQKRRPSLQHVTRFLNDVKEGKINDALGTGVGYLFPIVKYHANWDKLGTDDFSGARHGWHYQGKGYHLMGARKVPYRHGFDYMKPTDRIEPLGKKTEKYMEKIKALCDENDAKLVLLELPSASSWSMAKHNSIQAFADKHGLDFYDLNLNSEEFDLDWMTDTRDGGNHLNIFGASKATSYFGKGLRDRYELPDRREEPDYQHWREDAQRFEARKQENILKACEQS